MTWRDGKDYDKATVKFTDAELNSITPNDIVRYFKFKVYGDADVDEETTIASLGRASSLMMYKKSISSFMISDYQYNDETGTGNPTKSKRVNKLIRHVGRRQVQGNGKVSEDLRRIVLLLWFCLYCIVITSSLTYIVFVQ